MPGVAPVARHARRGAPDDLHPVAEGGTRDQIVPALLRVPREPGDQGVHVHHHVVVTLGHVSHVWTVLVGPHVSTQDLVTQQSVTVLRIDNINI